MLERLKVLTIACTLESWLFSLTPALSRWERESVRPRWNSKNTPFSKETGYASPSPSGRGPG